jgi:DNA-binding beta-propeller fold protein YncE
MRACALPTLHAIGALLLAACPGVIEEGAPDDASAPPTTFVRAWGQPGSANGEFRFPIGIAIDASDVVHVTDFRNGRIQRFTADGVFVSAFATDRYPSGIAIDSANGEIFVTHFGSFDMGDAPSGDKVAVYGAAGNKIREWGRTGSGEGELLFPGGIAISAGGRVYVADEQNHRVQVFDKQGTLLAGWGEHGPALGQFGMPGTSDSRVSGPNFLALDAGGDVYTTEGTVGRVQRFTGDGRVVGGWGNMEDVAGQFGGGGYDLGPIGLAVDRGGRIWVSAVSGRIQQFTRDGAYLHGFGSFGTGQGQFNVPHGLAFDSRGALYIVDGLNHRVQKFASQ